MMFAWYGHLKFQHTPLMLAIVASWGLAFFEYLFQVPANRIGAKTYTITQLKIMQEAITLCVFSVFAFLLFGQKPTVNTLISYAFVMGAVYLAFTSDSGKKSVESATHSS